jgi:hypothetical protein
MQCNWHVLDLVDTEGQLDLLAGDCMPLLLLECSEVECNAFELKPWSKEEKEQPASSSANPIQSC